LANAAEQIKRLHDLQQVDREIMEIEGFRKSAPEKIKALESEVEQHRQAFRDKEAEIKGFLEQRRAKERDLTQHEAQIAKNRERMMAVKTNEEYHAVQRENEKQKELIEELEDQILRIMEEHDSAEMALKKAKARFAEIEKQKQEQIAELRSRLALTDDQLAIKEGGRQKILPEIDHAFLGRYERLREITGGVAVVRVIKRTCQGCLVNVPPQVYNMVIRNEDIITCPSCRRILYYEPEAAANNNHGG
jgi:predicted  nucleic acid-binding Zn-ribbon protein